MNYLEKGSRLDIAYIMHQFKIFSSRQKKEHAKSVQWLDRYLNGTKDKFAILKPVKGENLEVFIDSNFAGNWDPKDTLIGAPYLDRNN